jgi:uncharacterized protein
MGRPDPPVALHSAHKERALPGVVLAPATPGSDMEYFFYCRAKPDTGVLWAQLTEAHWSFIDRYADAMIARGPTLTADRATATGSMHIVDLPDAEAARVFAFEEPCYLAGVYSEVMVRRWRNALGSTMWEFEGDPVANRRFLVIGHGSPDPNAVGNELLAAQRQYLFEGGNLEHMIAYGPLLSDDGGAWVGDAMLIEHRDRAGVEAMVASAPPARTGLYATVEVHDWEFGGRR